MNGQGRPLPFPAPTAGLNTRDGVALLQPNEARVLENWLPDGANVRKRTGYTAQSTGAGVAVKTLATHKGGAGEKLIAVGGGELWDVSGGAASSLHNGSYSDNVFLTAAYNGYLFGVNGTETPWRYDGSAHSATGFTGSGLTISNLINVAAVRNRLWFCESGSADVWYGGLGSITGALTKFQSSQLLDGGHMAAIGSWSRDSGDGMDDLTVFVASTGQVLVYSGDPASTFSLVGSYWMPRPIGRQCTVKIGGQLAILTVGGLIPLDAAMNGLAFDPMQLSTFGKVATSIQKDFDLYGSNPGWTIQSTGGLVYINVPTVTDSSAKQYVYNTRVGAWTLYTGLPINCMTEYDGDLYFGGYSNGDVWKHAGNNDNGSDIVLTSRQSFQNSGGFQSMQANLIRVDIAPEGDVTGKLGVDVDYISRPVSVPLVTLANAANLTPWGNAWGSSWNQKVASDSRWFSTQGFGRALSPAMVIYADAQKIEWYGTQLLVSDAGAL